MTYKVVVAKVVTLEFPDDMDVQRAILIASDTLKDFAKWKDPDWVEPMVEVKEGGEADVRIDSSVLGL